MNSGELFCQLVVRVVSHPAVVDQAFRFFQPELSFLKRLLRVPITGSAVDSFSAILPQGPPASSAIRQVWTRASDPQVLTESSSSLTGEPVDLLVKVGLGPAPQ
ncbi:unnamed protein product, partial [Protopolystoma xenopodis]